MLVQVIQRDYPEIPEKGMVIQRSEAHIKMRGLREKETSPKYRYR